MTAMAADVALAVEQAGRVASPERRLWGAALALMIDDAIRHHRRKADHDNAHRERVAAYNDLLSCGPQTQYLAAMAGYDAVWLSEQFGRLVERGTVNKTL